MKGTFLNELVLRKRQKMSKEQNAIKDQNLSKIRWITEVETLKNIIKDPILLAKDEMEFHLRECRPGFCLL